MGGKFCFFTDPALLGPQAVADAFGPELPVPNTNPGKDRFRVTDTHQPAIPMVAKAYAVCRGQICLQAAGASLNLILRPLVQPPFDFPCVEYFIYRGVRADSLLASDGQLDLGKEGTGANLNQLIAYIRERVLRLAAPQTTKVAAAHLGLDRKHDPAITAVDGGSWGDGQPLDHLFRYPGAAELPIVEAGWTLGEFGGTFGFEVVVQQYGAQPKIGWVRNADPWIEADKISTGTSAADLYASRLQREAIGCFADPCAFWGMFWSDGLTIIGQGAKKKAQLHAQLFGASPGIFTNRNRAYLDIRNEVGLSYDFYGTHQDEIRIGPAPGGLAVKSYSTGGWPIHYADPASATLCFSLRRDGLPSPRLFLRQGGENTPAKPFKKILDAGDLQWTSPVTFAGAGSAQPPQWFVADYIGRDAASASAVTVPGEFDTSPIQFGPIGDRVLAAYRQVWPATGGSTSAGTAPSYARELATDKVFRYDGGQKVDPANTSHSLAYDRMGETVYIFQKGTGANPRDSVVILHRRAYEDQRVPDRTPGERKAPAIAAAGGEMLFNALFGKLLSAPIPVKLLSAGVTIPSFRETAAGKPLRKELFDFTILLLSKAAFDGALAGAMQAGPTPGPGEQHPLFLSLGPATAVDQALVRDLGWKSWSAQGPTGSAASLPVYSAEGIFFASADFDQDALTPPVTKKPSLTVEETDAVGLWDSILARDKKGSNPADRMGPIANAFIDALLAVDSTDPDPPVALLALVEQYAPAIWNRGAELAADANYAPSSDLVLYYARLKMGVALKNHPLVAGNAATAAALNERFEALSRNYAGLTFIGAAAGDTRVIVTGFDPFGNEGQKKIKTSNPSGTHALYVAANPQRNYPGGKDFFAASCIFPVRWADFDDQIVEKTLEPSIVAAQAQNNDVALICTVSLDENITNWIEDLTTTAPITDLYCKIDGFAGRCRAQLTDNLNVTPGPISPTLPTGTDKMSFYKTSLRNKNLASYDPPPRPKPLDFTQPLDIKVRYDWDYVATKPMNIVAWGKYPVIVGQATWAPPDDPSLTSKVPIKGSGGDYLSNESYYRCSNLLRPKYSGIKNGHIHVPLLKKYIRNGTSLGVLSVATLAKAIADVIHGEL